MASEPSLGASGSFPDTPSIGLRARGDDRVEGFLGFGAGFADATSLRFLDAREEVLVPKIVPFTSFMVSDMLAFMSPISDRGGLVGPVLDIPYVRFHDVTRVTRD